MKKVVDFLTLDKADTFRFISFCIGFFVPVFFVFNNVFEHFYIQYVILMFMVCPFAFLFIKKNFGEQLG